MSSREAEARELGGEHRLDARARVPASAARSAAPGSGRRPRRCPGRSRCTRRIAPARSRSRSVGGQRLVGRARRRARPSRSTILPRSVLRNDAGASVISLSRKCGASPRSMSRVVISARDELVVGDRQRGAVVGEPARCPSSVPARARVEHDDLAPAAPGLLGVGRRLAVHAQVASRLLDQAVRLAGDDERVLGAARRRAPGRCRAARAAAGRASAADCARDGDRALERRDRSRGTPRRASAPAAMPAATRARGSPWRRW